jgi:hypothetical protein
MGMRLPVQDAPSMSMQAELVPMPELVHNDVFSPLGSPGARVSGELGRSVRGDWQEVCGHTGHAHGIGRQCTRGGHR